MKNEFKLSIARSKQKPKIGQKFLFETMLEAGFLLNTPHKFVGPAEISGEIVYDAGKVNLNLILRVPVEFVCDRCNEHFVKNLFVCADEVFWDENESTDTADENYYFSGDFIDILPVVRDTIITNFPTQILCKKDCKGVCAECGENLNISNCTCKKD